MAFTPITPADLTNKGVAGLPDTPDMEASELKQRFDSLGNLAIDRLKILISELEAETASLSVGAVVPMGITASKNVQSIINALTVIVQANEDARHRHTNFDVLEAISEETKDEYDRIALMLQGITDTGTLITNDDTQLSTCGAVKRYVDAKIAELRN